MKILQFAFENPNENDFLPHNYTPNCVCYTGTHDNDTTLGWYTQAYEASKDKLRRYYSTDASDICWVMIRACFSSVANMAIVPMQDVLKLDSWARMNTPGVGEGNWAWSCQTGFLRHQSSMEDILQYRRRRILRRSNHTTSQINAGTFKIA